MLKEFQDAAQIAKRKERLNTLVPVIAGVILVLVLVLTSQYTTLIPPLFSTLN